MGSRRRRFTREFKLEAVRMVVEGGHGLAQVARDLDIRPEQLRRWKQQLAAVGSKAFPRSGADPEERGELARLRRELRRVREERDILKKALAIFSDRQA